MNSDILENLAWLIQDVNLQESESKKDPISFSLTENIALPAL